MNSLPTTPSNLPLLFAHRGGMALGPENTLATFQQAVRQGVTGLESDVWLTADGIPVLHHGGSVGGFLRRRSIAQIAQTDLPEEIPTLTQLYQLAGNSVEVSLDVKDPAAVPAVLSLAREFEAIKNLWLCFPHWEEASSWRSLDSDFLLVDSPGKPLLAGQHERRAVQLSEAGFDAINMPETGWTAGHVALFHRFDLRCFGWNAQQPRQIERLMKMRIDGVFSDHPDRLLAAQEKVFSAR